MTEQEAFERHISFCKDNPYEVMACIGTAIETLSAYKNIESFRMMVEKAYASSEEFSETWNEIYEYIQNFAKWNLAIEKQTKALMEEEWKGGK